jgi:hypothetical protein
MTDGIAAHLAASPDVVLIHFLILSFVARMPIGALENKKGLLESSPLGRAVLLAVEHVHRDFKAKAHFGVFGFGPHGKAP